MLCNDKQTLPAFETALRARIPIPAHSQVEFSQVGHLMSLLNRLFMLNEALPRAFGTPVSYIQLTVFDQMCEFYPPSRQNTGTKLSSHSLMCWWAMPLSESKGLVGGYDGRIKALGSRPPKMARHVSVGPFASWTPKGLELVQLLRMASYQLKTSRC